MVNLFFPPTPFLAEVVESYWYSKVDLTTPVIQHYATPLLQGLIFNFKRQPEHHTYDDHSVTLDKQAYLCGQPLGSRIVKSSENGIDIIGVKFKPLGITRVTGINMQHVANSIIPAEDVWGRELELLCDEMQSAGSLLGMIAVLEKFLIDKYMHTSLHYRVESAQNAIALLTKTDGSMSVKDLQEQTNTTRKTLERAFLHYLGLKPKLFARIIRFNVAKEIIDQGVLTQSLTSLAHQCGYYDSSHFTAEFRRFAGLSPSLYLKNKKT